MPNDKSRINKASSIGLWRKGQGILLILYGLMPVILVALFLTALFTTRDDVKVLFSPLSTAVEETSNDVVGLTEAIGQATSSITQPIKEVTDSLKGITGTFKAAFQAIKDIPTGVTIPIINTPVQIPGLSELKAALNSTFSSLISLTDVFAKLPDLADIQTKTNNVLVGVNKIQTEFSNTFALIIKPIDVLKGDITSFNGLDDESIRRMRYTVIKILLLSSLIASFLLTFFIKFFIVPCTRWAGMSLRRGWSLLRESS